MFDAILRPIINIPLERMAKSMAGGKITPNMVSYIGFVIGVVGGLCLMMHLYIPALMFILLSRLADGLDGALARVANSQSDFGGYIDIVLDFIFYSGVVFAFAIGHPDQAIYAAFLIFSFMGTGSSFLAFAILAAKREEATDVRGKKSFFHVGGLAEGTETIITLCLICLMPQYFYLWALIFGLMCWITTLARISAVRERFG